MKVTVEHKRLKSCFSLSSDDIAILRKLSDSCRISQAELLKRCLKLYVQNESRKGLISVILNLELISGSHISYKKLFTN